MKTTIIALLGLAASCVTAAPTAPFKFTLTISSNQTDINGLGIEDARTSGTTMGTLESVSSLDEKPTVWWLEKGTEGRLVTKSDNGTLRYAFSWDKVNVGSIQIDQEGGPDGNIFYPKFKLLPGNFLGYRDFAWSFCPTDVDMVKRENYNLGGPLLMGESGCTPINVNVVRTD